MNDLVEKPQSFTIKAVSILSFWWELTDLLYNKTVYYYKAVLTLGTICNTPHIVLTRCKKLSHKTFFSFKAGGSMKHFPVTDCSFLYKRDLSIFWKVFHVRNEEKKGAFLQIIEILRLVNIFSPIEFSFRASEVDQDALTTIRAIGKELPSISLFFKFALMISTRVPTCRFVQIFCYPAERSRCSAKEKDLFLLSIPTPCCWDE